MSKENIEKALKTWLSISDMIPFDVIMATALAAMFPGDPVWLIVSCCSFPNREMGP
jgi:hypothetical protein